MQNQNAPADGAAEGPDSRDDVDLAGAPADGAAEGSAGRDDVALAAALAKDYGRLRTEIGRLIVGQDEPVDLVLLTLLAGGNSLLVGVPGLAKTLLIHTVAQVLDLHFSRIQFTPDLMPSDITGTDLVQEDPASGRRELQFVQGPVFANIVLADEINRTPPKTQSALLEAMQERRVSVQGRTYPLPAPFFVFATRNPIELEGTYPLPEAQLDRFAFEIELSHLPENEELAVVTQTTSAREIGFTPVLDAPRILAYQQLVRRVPLAEEVARYALALVRASRPEGDSAPAAVREWVTYGASVRAAQWLVLGAKARALTRGRYHVGFEDVQALARPVLRHRILRNFHAESERVGVARVVDELLAAVKPPARAEGAGPAMANAAGTRGAMAGERMLDPALLARLDDLDLVARTVVDGFVSGLHQAIFRGVSTDFAEHRAYTPGDDVRHVDWRVYARSDRLYVKQYEVETNADLVLAVDVSASMDFRGGAAVDKLQYARLLAASLAHLGARQRDRVGLVGFDDGLVDVVPPAVRHRGEVLHALDRLRPGGRGDLPRALRLLGEALRRRGIVVVISDFYLEPLEAANALAGLVARGHDVIALQVLDPLERDLAADPSLAEGGVLEDAESGERLPVRPGEQAEGYRDLVAAHVAAFLRLCGERRVDAVSLDSAAPLDEALRHYLLGRARLARVR